MEYTVVFLFDCDLKNVLLLKKNTTSFRGRLNGVGGKVGASEAPEEGAAREVREEAGASLQASSLNKLGEIKLVGDCTIPGDTVTPITLHYYAAVVPYSAVDLSINDEGQLTWEPVVDVIRTPVDSTRYAGDGDVQYMVYRAKTMLSQR